jgi:hypothetical protein
MRFKEFKIAEEGPLDAFYSQFISWGKDSNTATDATGSSADAGSGLANFKSSGSQINPNEIKAYLKSKGFDDNQAAGWLVNIKWESNFKPGAYVASDNGQGQSGGFFGFHDVKNGKGLFTKMVAATGGGNNWQTNWQGQLDFAMQDPRGQQYKSTKFSSPGEAAHWWVVNYEKPANTMQQAATRAASASKYA